MLNRSIKLCRYLPTLVIQKYLLAPSDRICKYSSTYQQRVSATIKTLMTMQKEWPLKNPSLGCDNSESTKQLQQVTRPKYKKNGMNMKMKLGYQQSNSPSRLRTNGLSKLNSYCVTTSRKFGTRSSSHSMSIIWRSYSCKFKSSLYSQSLSNAKSLPKIKLVFWTLSWFFIENWNSSLIKSENPVSFTTSLSNYLTIRSVFKKGVLLVKLSLDCYTLDRIASS